jgi:NAD+ synthase (glutamine-hydrolysing)
MKIAMAQLNPTVGDIDGNLSLLKKTLEDAARGGADLVVFPELYVTGYPPKDLLERRSFISEVESALRTLAGYSAEYPEMGILVGCPT